MVQYHKHAKTKNSGSGGLKRTNCDKRKAHWGGFFSRSKLGAEEKIIPFRTRGGRRKAAVHYALYANVASKGAKGVKRVKILNVVEAPADRHYARENIVSKGSIVETELGRAKITSRPGQDGVVNAVLLEEKR